MMPPNIPRSGPRFVCGSCRDGKDHSACENVIRTGEADSTWCDCQHRADTALDT